MGNVCEAFLPGDYNVVLVLIMHLHASSPGSNYIQRGGNYC